MELLRSIIRTRPKNVMPVPPNYEIICDANGMIITATDDVFELLLYDRNILLNQFIGTIMSPFMEYIHRTILFPRYQSATPLQKNIMHVFLLGKTSKRPLIIYNVNRHPISVEISVKPISGGNFSLKLNVVNDNNISMYLQNSTNLSTIPSTFKQSKDKIITITLDFKNQSKYLTDYGPLKVIELHTKFRDDLIEILKRNYYPYIYIYEMTNDSCVLILNASWTFNITRYSASLAVCFLNELYHTTRPYVSVRAGVTYDSLYYGTLDGHLRFFGVPFDLSSKYRNQCDENEICVDDNFTRKLVNEKVFSKEDLNLYSRTFYIDGLQHRNSNFIDITKIDPNKILEGK